MPPARPALPTPVGGDAGRIASRVSASSPDTAGLLTTEHGQWLGGTRPPGWRSSPSEARGTTSLRPASSARYPSAITAALRRNRLCPTTGLSCRSAATRQQDAGRQAPDALLGLETKPATVAMYGISRRVGQCARCPANRAQPPIASGRPPLGTPRERLMPHFDQGLRGSSGTVDRKIPCHKITGTVNATDPIQGTVYVECAFR